MFKQRVMMWLFIYIHTHDTTQVFYVCDVNDFGMGLWCVLIQSYDTFFKTFIRILQLLSTKTLPYLSLLILDLFCYL